MCRISCLFAACLLFLCSPAQAEEGLFARDRTVDYALAAEVAQNDSPTANLESAGRCLLRARELRGQSSEQAFVLAKRAAFHCVYAWMLLQNPRTSEEQTSEARALLGELKAFYEWDKEQLDRAAAGIGAIIQEVLTAHEARESIRRHGIDPKERAAADALERQNR